MKTLHLGGKRYKIDITDENVHTLLDELRTLLASKEAQLKSLRGKLGAAIRLYKTLAAKITSLKSQLKEAHSAHSATIEELREVRAELAEKNDYIRSLKT